MSKTLIQKLNQNKIQDGLLRDFISRGLYVAALGELPAAIERRRQETLILEQLHAELDELIIVKEETHVR